MVTKKNRNLVFRTLIIWLVVSSCAASYNSIVIETPNPSSNLLPPDISSLTLMNRSITADFEDFDKDSLQRYFYSRNFNVSSVVLDSVAADTTLKVLGDLLFNSGRYDIVIPKGRFFERDIKYNIIPDELDWDKVRAICEEFNTDALLVIERYYNKLDAKYTVHPATMEYLKHVTASIDSKYDVFLRIYDPEKEKVINMLVAADTISWSDADISTKDLFARLPSVKQCLIETGIKAALDFDRQLSPTWSRENRGYFSIEPEKDQAIAAWIANNNWQAAYDYWLPFAGSSNKATRSKAEYNLALASEMIGNIDDSFEWASKSNETQYHAQTERYLQTLNKRKEVLRKFQQAQ